MYANIVTLQGPPKFIQSEIFGFKIHHLATLKCVYAFVFNFHFRFFVEVSTSLTAKQVSKPFPHWLYQVKPSIHQGCQMQCTKAGKIYQMTAKLPNPHKLYPMAVKYSKWSECITSFSIPLSSKICQKFEFLVWKETIWQPLYSPLCVCLPLFRSFAKKQSCASWVSKQTKSYGWFSSDVISFRSQSSKFTSTTPALYLEG
jgi:hypothetical protein